MSTGGITFNGTSQYLEFGNKVISSFPYSLVVWVAPSSTGATQFWFAQEQGSLDRWGAAFLDANAVNKYAALRNTGNSDNATVSANPQVSSSALQLCVVVFASTTSRTIYFGNGSNFGSSSTSMTDDTTNHDRVTVAARDSNGSVGDFFPGTIAEAHIFNVALSSSDVTALLTTTPESVTGWVDGWKLASNTDLTSIGGTRTFTAVGSPTTGSLTLPYTRSAPAGTPTMGQMIFALQ